MTVWPSVPPRQRQPLPRPSFQPLRSGAPLTPEQIEAKLVTAIEVSADDQRDLIKQRAQAVQSFILKTGNVAPERLFIVTPKLGRSRQPKERPGPISRSISKCCATASAGFNSQLVRATISIYAAAR